MALTLGVSASAHASGSVVTLATTGVTTAASGSGFIIAVRCRASLPTSVSDSKSNSYTLLTTLTYGFSNEFAAVYYCLSGTGGASHTFTGNQTGFADMSVFAQEIKTGGSGLAVDNTSVAAISQSTSPFASNSLTTTAAATAIIAFLAGASASNPATHTVSGGSFAITQDQNNGAGGSATGALAAFIASTTQTSLVASFTETGNTPNAGVFIASFKESTGSGFSLPLGFGGYSLTGETATLSTGGITTNFTLLANAGAYSYQGAPASSDFGVDLASGSYSVSGQSITLSTAVNSFSMSANFGSYSYNGVTVNLTGPSISTPGTGAPMFLMFKGAMRYGRR